MTTAQSLTTAVRTDGQPTDGACAACPHPLAAHDAISLRYCTATAALAATTRGCICPAK